jgi:hypothetical protein
MSDDDMLSIDAFSIDDAISIDDSNDNTLQLNRSIHSSTDRINQQLQQLSQKETNSVRKLKIGMMVILTLSAVATGTISYWYLRHTERSKFRIMFEDDASKLGQSLYGNIINAASIVDLFATMMITNARAANDEYPFTSIPYFGNLASKYLSLSISINIWSVMLVNGTEQRSRWENYAWSQRFHVNETLKAMESDPNYRGEVPWNISMNPSIHDDNDNVPYNES